MEGSNKYVTYTKDNVTVKLLKTGFLDLIKYNI